MVGDTGQRHIAAEGEDMSEEDESGGGFLSAWSRRKLAARQAEQAEAEAEAVPEEVVEDDLHLDARPELESVDADLIASLPPLDEITVGSDITPFMARGVPAHLKNAALRKLWTASPLVRDYADPAVDYAWDWNAPGGVPGGGGVLSEQSVAKMVKDLIGGRDAEEVEVAEEVEGEAAEIPEVYSGPEGDTQSEPPEPLAVRRSDPAQRPEQPKPEPDAEPAEPSERQNHASLAPPRRHGGAVPE